MREILSILKKYLFGICCVVILIIFQANCDLALPEFVLYAVVKNLLENALLHANADVIEVSMQENTFCIQDNGTHLNAEDILYLGQRFWRKSAQQKGHGLGLSLVKMMLQQYAYAVQFEPNLPTGLKITVLSRR